MSYLKRRTLEILRPSVDSIFYFGREVGGPFVVTMIEGFGLTLSKVFCSTDSTPRQFYLLGLRCLWCNKNDAMQ